MKALIGGLLLSILSVSAPALAEAPTSPVEPPLVVEAVIEPEPSDLRAYALLKAQEYGISYHELSVTINCESSWNPNAVGDGSHSRGIAQIHAPSHPTITDEQAFDPYWALDWTARQFSEGNAWMWSCWKSNFL